MEIKFRHIVAVFVLLSIGSFLAYAQEASFNNTGGKLTNEGTIRVNIGQVKGLPDSLGGRIEFTSKDGGHVQAIPNIKYWQLVLKGKGYRKIRKENSSSHLIVGDSLIMIDSTKIELYEADIYAKNSVENTTKVYGSKEVRLNSEVKAQDMIGNGRGSFDHLNIDNPHGVNVIKGGFTVDSSLTLTRGKLNNTTQNFNMRDSSLITRYEGGALAEKPNFEGTIDVSYKGAGKSIQTGGELPLEKDKLQNLRVENAGGIVLTHDVQVNRSLYVGARIATEFDEEKRYVLTYTPAINPDFSMSPQAEIDGTFRRTFISYKENMLMNNRFTWALFKTDGDAGGVKTLNFRVKPKTFFALPEGNVQKVERSFEIWAEKSTTQSDTTTAIPNVDIGYGWRSEDGDDQVDESKGLDIPTLKLKRWNGGDWNSIMSSTVPEKSPDGKWYFASASNIDLLGKFVIGSDKGGNINLAAKVFLEGPYYDSLMKTELVKFNLLPRTPDDVYPYNLDKNRAKVKATIAKLDSIVDWIVMEFKPETGESQYASLLLKNDGTILSPHGDTVLNLTALGIDSGVYFIGVLHRNHLPVYTMKTMKMRQEYNGQIADFTKPATVYGKEGSLRPLDIKGGFILYGMVAGDVNGDNKIDETDYKLTWENRDMQFIRTQYDINMSGYVNTRDINFPWNNRNRSANIP